MSDTKRSLTEIEVAISKTNDFNYVKNIIAFNVKGIISSLAIFHECDMLVLNTSGFLTEIEIKRSWGDFLNDFKKKHKHEGRGYLKYFYYAIPKHLLDKVYNKLEEENIEYSGIITYDEDLNIKIEPWRYKSPYNENGYDFKLKRALFNHRKLFLEEQLQVARYGAMRSISLKEKLIKIKDNEPHE